LIGLEHSRDQRVKTKTKTAEFSSGLETESPRLRSRGLQDCKQPWPWSSAVSKHI